MLRQIIRVSLFVVLILLASVILAGSETISVHAEGGGNTAHEPSHAVVQIIPLDGASILAKAGRVGNLSNIGASLRVGSTAHEPSHADFDPPINGYAFTFDGVATPYTSSPVMTFVVTTTSAMSDTIILGASDFEQRYIPGDAPLTISSLDTAVRLFMPAGALLPDSYVVINNTVQLPGDLPAGFRQLGQAYSIRASGAVTQSLAPMILDMDYEPGMLAGRDPYTVSMFWWDEAHNQWQDVESEPMGYLPAQSKSVRRFGIYVLMAGTTWRDTLQNYDGLGNRRNVRLTSGRLELSSSQTNGYAESIAIAPSEGFAAWESVHFVTETSSGTSLTVDILAADRTLLLSNVSDSVSLAGIDPIAHPSLILRANLASQHAGATPSLDSWSLSWRTNTLPTQHRFLPLVRGGIPAYQSGLPETFPSDALRASQPPDLGMTTEPSAQVVSSPRLDPDSGYGCEPPSNPPVTWTPAVRLTSSDTISIAPELAADRQGRLHAVWYNSGRVVLYASKAPGGAWSTPTIIPGSANAYYPDIEVDAQGMLHVIWLANGNIVYATKPTNGSWSSPVNVSSAGQANVIPQIHSDATGNLHLIWSDSSPGNAEIFYRRKTAGGAWSVTERVSNTAGTSWAPDVAADSQGKVHVVWYENGEIFYAWRSVAGDWSAPVNISQTAGSSLWPALGISADDTLHLVWPDRLPVGINGDVFILYYAEKPAAGSWSTGLELARVPGSGQNLMAPSLAVGPTGALHVAWATVTEWALRYLTRPDSETGWSAAQVVAALIPAPVPSNQWYFPGLTVAPDRSVHLLWNDMVSPIGFNQDIFYSAAAPPPIPANHVAVIDGSGRAVRGACVYQNGRLVGVSDALGIVAPASIAIGDRLVAMKPLDERPHRRGDWAYRTSLTSLTMNLADPNTQVSGHKVTQLGRQALRLNPALPLVTFNLVVSLQWNATPAYMQEISTAVRLASDYLFDVSNGQMALGQVTIYDDGQQWEEADVQMLARQFVRPYAYIGGLRSTDPADVIRVGRQWDRWGGTGRYGTGHGYWNEADGYRTLIHEFGHYGLTLLDSYFGYIYANGQIVGINDRKRCTDSTLDSQYDAVNASIMNMQYNASEWSSRGAAGLWSSMCEETAQWQIYQESDWETVLRRFADTAAPPRWQLSRPITGSAVITGPVGLPSNLLPFPQITVHEQGDAAPLRQITVRATNGQAFAEGAQVAIDTYRNGRTVVINQGQTNANGQITVYGAVAGDTLRATSLSGSYSAQTVIGVATSYVITLGVAAGRQDNSPAPNAYLSLIPSPEGDDLTVVVGGVGSNSIVRAIISPPGPVIPASIVLQSQGATGVYSGTAHFRVASTGMGDVNLVGSTAGDNIRQDLNYHLGAVDSDTEQNLYSPDGAAWLHLEPGSFTQSNVSMVLMPTGAIPQPLPTGMIAVGQAYALRASGGITGTEHPAVLRLFYDPTRLGNGMTPADLRIARWNDVDWQVQPSQPDPDHLAISAVVNDLGIYVLLAASPSNSGPRLYLPQVHW